jgi:zinc-ribbon domain
MWIQGGFIAGVVLIGLAVLAFDVWMLVDAIQRPPEQFSTPDAKTWWIVGFVVGLVTGFPAIAVAIAYYIVVRRPARAPAHAGVWTPSPVTTPGAPATPPPMPVAPAPNCRNCGAKIVAGARFCHSCGAPTI